MNRTSRCASSFNHSIDKDRSGTHHLMDLLYYYQLHGITVNLFERVRLHRTVSEESEQTSITTPLNSDSLAQTKELGVYTDSNGVTSFTCLPSFSLSYATDPYVFVYTSKITPFVVSIAENTTMR